MKIFKKTLQGILPIINIRKGHNYNTTRDQSEHIIGPGSHVGFQISAKNKNLVYDHPMNISAKFGSNLFCGFRKLEAQVSLYRSPGINKSS